MELLEGCAIASGREDKAPRDTTCTGLCLCPCLEAEPVSFFFFFPPSAIKLGEKSREKKVCWLRSSQINLL